jgi:hypothetical protein
LRDEAEGGGLMGIMTTFVWVRKILVGVRSDHFNGKAGWLALSKWDDFLEWQMSVLTVDREHLALHLPFQIPLPFRDEERLHG